MKYLFLIYLFFLSTGVWAQNGCFRAIQGGQPVEVICAGTPVFFRDCNTAQDPDAIIFYSPGPEALDLQNYNQDDLLTAEEPITLTQPGEYIITQVINFTGGGGTKVYSKTYQVKSSPEPTFTYDRCANGLVNFTVTDSNYDSYTFDFGDGSTETTSAGVSISHKYNTEGSYNVTLSGTFQNADCSNSSDQTIQTLPPLPSDDPIQIDKLTVLEQGAAGSIQLELSKLVPGYNYVIERYTGDFRNPYEEVGLMTNISSSTFTQRVDNVNTGEATWYLVRPVDACNSNDGTSNVISSIALALTAQEEEITLNWATFNNSNFEEFDIYKNGSFLATKGSNDRTYIDLDVSCGQTYTYYIIGKNTDPEGDPYSSVSVPIAIEVSSTATPQTPYLLASFNLNNQLELTLQEPSGEPIQHATFERSINGATYQQLTQVQQLTYTDAEAPLQATCYRATVTNRCGNTSPVSNTSCPVILQAERQIDGSVTLSWSAYTGFPGGVSQYTVELLDENRNVAISYPATGTAFTDRTLSNELPVLRYRIKATSQNNSGVTYSNLVEIEQDVMVHIPSAFTPNGDGLNDVFEVKGKFFSGYTLRVYNQQGHVVYEGTEADAAWNGTNNGEKLRAGAYAYIITVKSSFGTTKQKTGTITLLR